MLLQVRSFHNRHVPDDEKVSVQEEYAIMLRNTKLLYGNVTLPCCGVAPGNGANPKRNMLLFDGLVRLVASSKLAIADTSTVNGAQGQGQAQAAATAALADAAEEPEACGATCLLLEASNGAAAGAQPGSGISSAAASGSPASSADTVAAELAWLKTADALPEADWDHASAYVSQE